MSRELNWWDVRDHAERAKMIFPLKVGPYRHMHRVECECAACCGPDLARQIARFNEDAR